MRLHSTSNDSMNIAPFHVFSCGHANLKEALSVRRSVGPLVCWSVVIEMKSGITSVLDTLCECLCEGVGTVGLGYG